MTRKKTPTEPFAPVPGAGAVANQFAQVVEALKLLQERQERMALDLSALKEGIATLAEQVAQVVQLYGEQSQQEQDVQEMQEQVSYMTEQLSGIITPPPPEEGGGGGPSPATTPASSSGPSPATGATTTPARPSSTPMQDQARARRAANVPRVGGSAG